MASEVLKNAQCKIRTTYSDGISHEATAFLSTIVLSNGDRVRGLLTTNHLIPRKDLLADAGCSLSIIRFQESHPIDCTERFYHFTCDFLNATFIELSPDVLTDLVRKQCRWLSCETNTGKGNNISVLCQSDRDEFVVALGSVESLWGTGLLYSIKTEKTSEMKVLSGSPVLSDSGQVVGIHDRAFSDEWDCAVNIRFVHEAIEKDHKNWLAVREACRLPRPLNCNDLVELEELIGLVRCNPTDDFSFISPKSAAATPLWFHRTSHHWFWTPTNPNNNKNANWMEISVNASLAVIGGEWDGMTPADRNCKNIRYLARHGDFYLQPTILI